uniref:Endothelial differentiation related factor 1 n=1 Tax=Laticauda laticaudata TaxID=8630 RepID=A0A8C5WPN1_LATLA
MAESDWDTVTVLRKKGPSAAQAKSKQVRGRVGRSARAHPLQSPPISRWEECLRRAHVNLRRARPPSASLHGLSSRGARPAWVLPARGQPGRLGGVAAGTGSTPRPFPVPGRRARRAPPAGQESPPPAGGGCRLPGMPRNRPAEEVGLLPEGAGWLSFHRPVTLPLLFRLCWRPSGEAKTWRPPKSVGVAGGRARGALCIAAAPAPARAGGGRADRGEAPSPTVAGPAPSPAGAAGQNKQHSITKNTAKLDRETEELHHDRVPLEVGKVIQQGRQNKGLTQKDLATKINEKPQVIADYESGKAIPNNQVLGKIERAIGLKLRGRDIGRPLEKAPKGK